ncbi:MAG TPA: two-component sensor histidine kinase [Flavobacteriales bacterium]|nr:ATP-binding protein [Salibacteraceae bacterium]HAS35890.1 two-component sensor histidine kinase [Flavobacteriales bacterium]
MRETSSRTIAFYSSLVITAISSLLVILAQFLYFSVLSPRFTLIFALIIFAVSFGVSYAFTQVMIRRKLNLLFRILQGKQSNGREVLRQSEAEYETAQREAMKFATESRQQIEELRKQAVFRRDFIGNLSHELKTPLFSVQGYLQTLLEGGLEDKNISRPYLQKADKNLDRILELVDDLDGISKLESGTEQLDLKNFDLIELIKDVISDVKMAAQESKIKIRMSPKSGPIMVKADQGRIHQVVMNLLVNSINYGRDEGKIEVIVHSVGDNCVVEVSDDGLGISKEDAGRIFERFYRVEKSRNRHKGGSGLGLAIVKHIIEAHGQTINVRSEEGKGSSFSFTLSRV